MRPTATKSFPPPTSGWIASGNALTPPEDGAEVLDNWFPTAMGARMRRGSALHATLGADPVRLFTYRSGSQSVLYAATTAKVYDITTPADPEVEPSAELSSQTSGDWSTVQTSTAGGDFMIAVNGSDNGFWFDGTTLEVYGTTYSITGVSVADLSHVNLYASRLFFVEEGTMNVWYLGVDSIAGAATKFPMGSVFRKGGFVLATATWSLDAGDGMDDKFVAITSEGEVAVYEGIDPASWSLAGVYEIGTPVDKHAALKIGGDLAFVCDIGLIPISQAIAKDRAQLVQAALSYKIEDAWRDVITNRTSAHVIPAIYWQAESLLLIGTGETSFDGPVSFVANPRTGSWARYVGWDVLCASVMDDTLYFGSDGSVVYKGETGGSDAGESYRAIYVPTFSTCGTPGIKVMNGCNAVFRGTVDVKWGATAYSDFAIGEPPVSTVLPEPDDTAVWGTFTWGSFAWGGVGRQVVTNTWKSVATNGFTVAPCIVTTSLGTAPPDIELMATQIRYEVGEVL